MLASNCPMKEPMQTIATMVQTIELPRAEVVEAAVPLILPPDCLCAKISSMLLYDRLDRLRQPFIHGHAAGPSLGIYSVHEGRPIANRTWICGYRSAIWFTESARCNENLRWPACFGAIALADGRILKRYLYSSHRGHIAAGVSALPFIEDLKCRT